MNRQPSIIMKIIFFVIIFMSVFLPRINAVSSLVASSGVISDGILQVCPDTIVNLTCSHSNDEMTTGWEISFSSSDRPDECYMASNTSAHQFNSTCGSFRVFNTLTNSRTGQLSSTLELPIKLSLDGTLVTCFAGDRSVGSQVGNYTIRVIAINIFTPRYGLSTMTVGRVEFEVSISESFGTNVSYSDKVVNGSSSVEVDGNSIILLSVPYNEPQTISIVATSEMSLCPDNRIGREVNIAFIRERPDVTEPTILINCSNPSFPISGSFQVATRVFLPLNGLPIITYTTAEGRNGSADHIFSSSFQLANSTENNVYTFNVTAANSVGSASALSERIAVVPLIVDESTIVSKNCLTFSLGPNCISDESGDFSIEFQQAFGDCQNLSPSNFVPFQVPLNSQSACIPIVISDSSADLCYSASLVYKDTLITTLANFNSDPCSVSDLEMLLTDNVMYKLDREVNGGNVPHFTTASLKCLSFSTELSGSPQVTCINGRWQSAEPRSCSVPNLLVVIVVLVPAIVLIIALLLAVSVTAYCCVKRHRLLDRPVESSPPELGESVYDDPDEFHFNYDKSYPETEENVAYGYSQKTETEIREEWLFGEYARPHPHTEANVAYLHAQFSKHADIVHS